MNDVAPHDLVLVRPTLIERLRRLPGFCRHCYVLPRFHPVVVWSEARPWDDRTRRGPYSVGLREDLELGAVVSPEVRAERIRQAKPAFPPINPSNRGG